MYYFPTDVRYKKHNYKDDNELTVENKEYIKNFKSLLNKSGSGIVNTVLNKVPLPELHMSLPSNVSSENITNGSFNNTKKYSYCGPKTKVQQRLKEGYKGVNTLDKACKQHDEFYSKYPCTKDRNRADDILANEATKISLDESKPQYERNDARLVTGVMALKSRFGMGLKKKKF